MASDSSQAPGDSRTRTPGYLWFALLFPTVLTYVYFNLLAGSSTLVHNGTYGIGKLIQFVLPAWFVLRVAKEQLRLPRIKTAGLGVGVGFGVLAFVMVLPVFEYGVKHAAEFSQLEKMAAAKVEGFGLASVSGYISLSLFYCLVHSGLEEYYWRWFVFGRLKSTQGVVVAGVVSSIGFTLHHVLLLATFFEWSSIYTYLFSIAVGIGGAFWAWLYHRTSNICSVWISHAIIDAAIFYLGYSIVFGSG